MILQITSKRLRIYRNRPNGEIVTLISQTCVEYDMLNQQRESFMHKEGLFCREDFRIMDNVCQVIHETWIIHAGTQLP